jgi:8-oxo-dGTP pyrophosphatase MutT (NUDIX family)
LPKFRKLAEEEVWQGRVISVAVGTFEGPDGKQFERDIVHHPGAVVVVPVVDEGESAMLVRQYRSAIDTELLELPAGKRDQPGEPPETTARRELIEEIGMRAGRIEQLCRFYNTPGFCDELAYMFLALDLEPCANDLQGIEEQHMTVERIALEDAPRLIAEGVITDAKTIIGLTLAREHLRR